MSEPFVSRAPEPKVLFQFDQELAEMLALRSEMLSMDPPEDVSALDGQLIAYFQDKDITADRLIPLWRSLQTAAEVARAEANRLKAYADDLESQLEHLKLRAKEIMVQLGKKVIPGATGRVMLKGNGGNAPIHIQEELLPDELCKWEGTIYGTAWRHIPDHFKARPDVKMKRLASNTAVRAALAKPCPICDGNGSVPDGAGTVVCPHCGGGKLNFVAGARLMERGQHIEIK